MAKTRVHELAKELGVESKVILARLKLWGVFVKSASSTLDRDVAARVREHFEGGDVGAHSRGRRGVAPGDPDSRRSMPRRDAAVPGADLAGRTSRPQAGICETEVVAAESRS